MNETVRGGAIRLRGNDNRHIPIDKVHFAFASGRFSYDCMTCNAQCCRGHGYAVEAGDDLTNHLSYAPTLAAFVRAEQIGTTGAPLRYMVRNCPPACFFLDNHGRCGIHARNGYEAKPETCRLFPFNNARVVGGHLIIAPHASLCPLACVRPPLQSPQSDHVALLCELESRGIAGALPELPSDDTASTEAAFALERLIVRRSETHLTSHDYTQFAAEQLVLATLDVRSAPADTDYTAATSKLAAYRKTVLSLLGQSSALCDGDLSDVTAPLIAATPFLRTELVFARPGVPSHLRVPSVRVPHFLMSLFVLLVMAKRAGMQDVTFQTISRLFSTEWPLLALLSRSSDQVVWSGDRPLRMPATANAHQLAQLAALAKAILPKAQRRVPASLGTVLGGVADASGIGRFALLRSFAEPVLSAIAPIESASRLRAWRRRRLAALRRLAWAGLNEQFIVAAITRRQRSRPHAQVGRAIA